MNRLKGIVSIVLSVAVVAALIFGFYGKTQAGPSVPSNVVVGRCATPGVQTLYSAIITQTTRGAVIGNALVGPYCSLVDIQWTLSTSGTAANGVTLAWQVSNDNSNWATASTITSGITSTAAGDMVEVANFGLYSSVYATLTSTAQVTLTAIGLFK